MDELWSELQPPTEPTAFEAHTDGACLRNPDGPGGWAAVIGPAGSGLYVWELWGHLSSTSNNRAEALGVLAALEWVPTGSSLLLNSDSELTVNVLAGRYKAKANLDLWTEIRRTIANKRISLQPRWVQGHAGDPGNERADRLSVLGAANGDARRLERLRPNGAPARPRGAASAALPAELSGLQPQGAWETDFLKSLARQLRAGKTLSEKQQAIVDRIRRRAPAGGTS